MQSVLSLAESRSVLESAEDAWRRDELGRFLREWRGRLTPADVGLPSHGFRRVRGLRREEVAELADVSVGWYTSFELATAQRVSLHFATRIADVLRLDETERTFLFALLGAPLAARSPEERREALEAIVAAGEASAIIAVDGGLRIVSHSEIWRRLFGGDANGRGDPENVLDGIFDDPRLREEIENWDALAGFGCGALRMQLACAHAEARGTFERFASNPVFMAHWQRRTLYDPQDVQIRFALQHPVMGRIPLRLIGVGLYHSSNMLFVISGDGAAAGERLRRLHDDARS